MSAKNTLFSKVIIQIWRRTKGIPRTKIEFINTRPALQEMLKGVLLPETKRKKYTKLVVMNFQMFKLVLEMAEEAEIKLPTSTGSWKKQTRNYKTPRGKHRQNTLRHKSQEDPLWPTPQSNGNKSKNKQMGPN